MTFALALQGESRLVLDTAICIYKSASGEAYATKHAITRTGQAPALGAGKPLTRKALGNIVAMLGKGANTGSYLSPKILSIGFDYMIWHEAPTQQNVFFKERTASTSTASIGTRGGNAPQPGLVFAVRGNNWWVFSVKGADRPTPTTELCHSPYWNVNQSGAICTGNVKTPGCADPDSIEEWRRVFFASNFTHSNFHGAKQVEGKGGMGALWTDLLDGKYKKFPQKKLIPNGMTLSQLIQKTNSGGN
jgi:PRTRC genetic system protein B